MPLAMRSRGVANRRAREKYNEFVAEHGKASEHGGVRIGIEQMLAFQRVARDMGRSQAASVLVPKSFLVALISQYDSFLGLLVETLLLARPEILNGSERTLSFSELVEFGSVEAARDHVIEKEVESLLRKSHAEQFDWLEGKFGLQLRKGLAVWPEL